MSNIESLLKNIKLQVTPSYGNSNTPQFDGEWLILPKSSEIPNNLPEELKENLSNEKEIAYITEFFDNSSDNYFSRWRIHLFDKDILKRLILDAKENNESSTEILAKIIDHYSGYENSLADETFTKKFDKTIGIKLSKENEYYKLSFSNNRYSGILA